MSRPLPEPDADTEFFWKACAQGRLEILRCSDCNTYVHPPRAACRACGGANLSPAHVSGRGTVHSYTVTHRALPGFEPPFAVVLVELEEQKGLRLISNIVGVAPEAIRIGMPVRAVFESVAEGVFLPLFERRT